MKFELFFSRRLKYRSGNQSTLSPSIVIAVAGVAVSLIVMLLSVSIVVGFKKEITNRIMGFNPHIALVSASDYIDEQPDWLNLTDSVRNLISGIEPKSVASVVQQSGILKTDDDFCGLVFRGISKDYDTEFLSSNLKEGKLPTDTDGVLISALNADKMRLKVGDRVFLYFFIDNIIKARRLPISGIYDSHFTDYDKSFAYLPLSVAQDVNSLEPGQSNRIEINVGNADIDAKAAQLEQIILAECIRGERSSGMAIENVHKIGALYFNWLDLLNMNVVVVLVLMAIVSLFTLISSLIIIILERVNTIGILKALGSTNKQIKRIFILMAIRLVLIGLAIGNVIALGVLFLQKFTHIIPLDPDSYYLTFVPTDINLWHIIAINLVFVALSYVTLILPAQMISKMSPAETIRYE
ncbi:MAG: ABC transporter permease [Muribaculaceae bacterium]|nr:ABC transporter permease [Muribaculaceae bacterium]